VGWSAGWSCWLGPRSVDVLGDHGAVRSVVVPPSATRPPPLSDPRIAARITAILGQRLVDMERRLSDTVFKSVPQRIATTLATLAGQERRYLVGSRAPVVALTHEQIAALVGTSRETVTKILDNFADRGLVRLGRGRVTLLDVAGIDAEAGD